MMKPMTIRLESDVAKELDELAKILGNSKNAVINLLIRQEYSKYHDDPKIKRALEQMAEIRAVLERFQS